MFLDGLEIDPDQRVSLVFAFGDLDSLVVRLDDQARAEEPDALDHSCGDPRVSIDVARFAEDRSAKTDQSQRSNAGLMAPELSLEPDR